MANAGGRPTKYDPNFIEEVDRYIATTGREQTALPTVQGLALHLNVNKTSLYEWAKAHEGFSNALEKLMDQQGQQLINDGIYGGKEVNSTIVKLLLMNNHGMREKSDVTTDDAPIQTIDVGALLAKVYGPNSDTSTDEVPTNS